MQHRTNATPNIPLTRVGLPALRLLLSASESSKRTLEKTETISFDLKNRLGITKIANED
jgi:hypothetical protein